MTACDTTLTEAPSTLFTGNLTVDLDLLIDGASNQKGVGSLFLFNEARGEQGLALTLAQG